MKLAVVILAHPGNKGALARAVNAMALVKEAQGAGDDVVLVLDGAGTMWAPELADENHKYHQLFLTVRDQITAVCEYCANIFEVERQVEDLGLPLVDEFDGHPSLRSLAREGYQLVTF